MPTVSSISHPSGRHDVHKREPEKEVRLTPTGLLNRYSLPVAAYLKTPTKPPGLDLSRPLMLYSSYSSTKIRASSLRLSRDGTLSKIGPGLVIPDSYTGWFTVLGPHGRGAPFYSSIEQVVGAKMSCFLTRYDVPAYVIKGDASSQAYYRKTLLPSGHVIKVLGIFEDSVSFSVEGECDRISSSSSTAKKNSHHSNMKEKFAKCKTFNDQIVYFPFTTPGRFFWPAHKQSKSNDKVYLISHLSKNFKMPVSVKLVCGYMPKTPCEFTGLLRLEKPKTEEVILACTINPEATATLFEIEVASKFEFVPVTDALFPKTPIYLKTVSYCEDEADDWRKQIKVTHNVTEKRSRSLTRSFSDKFGDPLNGRGINLTFLADLDRRRSYKDQRSTSIDRFTGYPKKEERRDEVQKMEKKQRRLSKQNTYIFHLDKRLRGFAAGVRTMRETRLSNRLSQSFDNLDYSRHRAARTSLSDKVTEESLIEEEDLYAEIEEPPLKKEKPTKMNENSINNFIESLISKVEGNEDETMEICKESKACEISKDESSLSKVAEFKNVTVEADVHSKEKDDVTPLAEEKKDFDYIIEGEDISVISIDSFRNENDNCLTRKLPSDGSLIFGDAKTNEEKANSVTLDERKERHFTQGDSMKDEEERNNLINSSSVSSINSSEENKYHSESKSRILMRGNTVVIRVKDTETKKIIVDDNDVKNFFSAPLDTKLNNDNYSKTTECLSEKSSRDRDSDDLLETDENADSLSCDINHEPISMVTNLGNFKKNSTESIESSSSSGFVSSVDENSDHYSPNFKNRNGVKIRKSQSTILFPSSFDTSSEGYESVLTTFSTEEFLTDKHVLYQFDVERLHSEKLNEEFVSSINFPFSSHNLTIKNSGNVQFASSPEDDLKSMISDDNSSDDGGCLIPPSCHSGKMNPSKHSMSLIQNGADFDNESCFSVSDSGIFVLKSKESDTEVKNTLTNDGDETKFTIKEAEEETEEEEKDKDKVEGIESTDKLTEEDGSGVCENENCSTKNICEIGRLSVNVTKQES